MTATQALQATLKQLTELDSQINVLHEQGSQARDVSGQAAIARQQAAALKQQKRSLLARLFLGEPPADTSALDAQIHQALGAVDNLQDGEEAAQTALTILQQQIDALARQRQAVAVNLPGLRHAVLLENARAAADAYESQIRALGPLYAKAAGAIMAANLNADPATGRMYAGPLAIDFHPAFPTQKGAIRLNLEDEIRAAQVAAKAALPG